MRRWVWPPSCPRSKCEIRPVAGPASAGSKSVPSLSNCSIIAGRALDDPLYDVFAAKARTCVDGVAARGPRRSPDRPGPLRSRPCASLRRGICSVLLGDDGDGAVLGDLEAVEESGDPASDDEDIGVIAFLHGGSPLEDRARARQWFRPKGEPGSLRSGRGRQNESRVYPWGCVESRIPRGEFGSVCRGAIKSAVPQEKRSNRTEVGVRLHRLGERWCDQRATQRPVARWRWLRGSCRRSPDLHLRRFAWGDPLQQCPK